MDALYFDPNFLDKICEVSWEIFKAKEFESRRKSKSQSRYVSRSSLQHEIINDSKNQVSSTCLLVALNSISDNDDFLKKIIDFIDKTEFEKFRNLEFDFKDSLKNPDDTEVIKEFESKYFVKSEGCKQKLFLTNIFIDIEDPETYKFLQNNLKKDSFQRLDNEYKKYQKNYLLILKFVLEKYCNSKEALNSSYDISNFYDEEEVSSFEFKTLHEKFQDYAIKHVDTPIRILEHSVNNLYKKLAKLNHLQSFDYKDELTLKKDVIDRVTKRESSSPTRLLQASNIQIF